MTRSMLFVTATAMLSALPALADISADDVWDNWQKMGRDIGQTLSAAETIRENGTLLLKGVDVTLQSEDETIRTRIDEVTLTERSDGTVRIVPSPTYRITIDARGSDGEDVDMVVLLSHEGLDAVATGTPERIDYAYTAEKVDMTLESFETSGPPVDLDFDLALSGLSGNYLWGDGAARAIESAFAADALAVSLGFDDPEEEASGEITLTMQALAGHSRGTLRPFSMAENIGVVLRDGLTSESAMTFGATAYKFDVEGPDGQMILEGSTESGRFDARLDADGLSYESGGTGTAISLLAPGAMLPPLSLEIAETASSLKLPLLKSETVQDFALSTRLTGFEMSDMIWSMIDPTAGLPRGPANLEIDVSGTGRWTVEVTDPDEMERVESAGEVPGEIDTLDINAMDLSIAGAALSGTGAFTFDNGTTPPTPEGELDLTLVGANALIDNLVAIGILPEDQAMGARMMLGLFARPGAGEDTLTSTIELKPDGSVIANGQRIR